MLLVPYNKMLFQDIHFYTPAPRRGRGYTVLPLSVLPSVQDIFRHIFLSNCWWQKSDIWSQASYRYPISWEAFLEPSDSYFLFADFVDFYTHLTYICICTFFVAFFVASIDDRNLIFGHKLHIGMPYCGKRFGPVIFLLPVCQLSWFLYTFNIYAHFSSHFSQQLLMAEIWYLVTSFI
jgi:hypothetical protein